MIKIVVPARLAPEVLNRGTGIQGAEEENWIPAGVCSVLVD